MSAVGKVKTGFSLPYVAKYTASGNSVSYTSGMRLARGVEASYDIETSDDNNFYADNIEAESDSGTFTGGSLNLTVDGLLAAAEKLIMGLHGANTQTGLISYGDDQSIPDVGVGFIFRFQSDGEVTYTPIIFPRVKFNQLSESGATQEESIDWQTQELTADIKRADDANRTWKYVGSSQTSEAAAEAVIKSFFSIPGTVTT